MKNVIIETFENTHGLSYDVETVFVEKDQFGNPVNEYCINEYSAAKMYLYKDATKLLPIDEEKKAIENILSIGLVKLLNQNYEA